MDVRKKGSGGSWRATPPLVARASASLVSTGSAGSRSRPAQWLTDVAAATRSKPALPLLPQALIATRQMYWSRA